MILTKIENKILMKIWLIALTIFLILAWLMIFSLHYDIESLKRPRSYQLKNCLTILTNYGIISQ